MLEQGLVESARTGDRMAFAGLVKLYQANVYSLCYRMLGEAAEAEDAAQETFLRAYRQLQSYDSSRPFKTWLLAIGSHHCIDRLRQRRSNQFSLDGEPDEEQAALPDPCPNPEEVSLEREQSARIRALLAGLAPEDRSVIVMRYWHDLSYEEIAETTGHTVSAVKSRLHRARATMALRLRQEPDGATAHTQDR